jgi:hypothetical protein
MPVVFKSIQLVKQYFSNMDGADHGFEHDLRKYIKAPFKATYSMYKQSDLTDFILVDIEDPNHNSAAYLEFNFTIMQLVDPKEFRVAAVMMTYFGQTITEAQTIVPKDNDDLAKVISARLLPLVKGYLNLDLSVIKKNYDRQLRNLDPARHGDLAAEYLDHTKKLRFVKKLIGAEPLKESIQNILDDAYEA